MEAIESNDIGCQCCLCGERIRTTPINPCNLNILTNVDKPKENQFDQIFYCHAECFKLALHDDIKNYLVLKGLVNEEG